MYTSFFRALFILMMLTFSWNNYAQILVIDAGHGINADGSNGDTRTDTEINTNMAVSLKLKDRILADCNNEWTVHLTRENNDAGSWISLAQRVTLSNDWGADRFISIHCNAGGGTGTETYWRQNTAINPSIDLDFASKINDNMVRHGDWTDRGVKEHNWWVLSTIAPSVLHEIGFVDTSEDQVKLLNDAWRDKFTTALFLGINQNITDTYSVEGLGEPIKLEIESVILSGTTVDVRLANNGTCDFSFSDFPTRVVVDIESDLIGYESIGFTLNEGGITNGGVHLSTLSTISDFSFHDYCVSAYILSELTNPAGRLSSGARTLSFNECSSTGSGLFADFSHQVEETNPLKVYFTDNSLPSGEVHDWEWDFGDGMVLSGVQNPSHAFTAPGNYTVTLTAIIGTVEDTRSQVVTLNASTNLPIIDFEWDEPVKAGLVTQFFDRTLFPCVNSFNWSWTFHDQYGTYTSSLEDPNYTFDQEGTFEVELCATDGCGAQTCASKYVTVEPQASAIVPNFLSIGNYYNINKGTRLAFYDLSDPREDIVQWSWYFTLSEDFNGHPNWVADMNYNSYKEPEEVFHTYNTVGRFKVRLYVSDDEQVRGNYKDVIINVSEPSPIEYESYYFRATGKSSARYKDEGIDMDGRFLVKSRTIPTPNQYSDEPNSGHFEVFERDSYGWTSVANLSCSCNMIPNSAQIANDVVVALGYKDGEDPYHDRKIYIFEKPSSGWEDASPSQIINASSSMYYPEQLAFDGEDIILVSKIAEGNVMENLYIYERNSSGWPSSPSQINESTSHVSGAYATKISGHTLLVMNWEEMLIFEKNQTWTLLATIHPEGDDDFYRASIENKTIVVHAGYYDNYGPVEGIKVYEKPNIGWYDGLKPVASLGGTGSPERLGTEIEISGNRIFAFSNRGPDLEGKSAKIYGYEKSGSTWTSTTESFIGISSNDLEFGRNSTMITSSNGRLAIGDRQNIWVYESNEYNNSCFGDETYSNLDTPYESIFGDKKERNITSNSIVINGGTVDYTIENGKLSKGSLFVTAGTSITIKPNFHAMEGSVMHLRIEPCNE